MLKGLSLSRGERPTRWRSLRGTRRRSADRSVPLTGQPGDVRIHRSRPRGFFLRNEVIEGHRQWRHRERGMSRDQRRRWRPPTEGPGARDHRVRRPYSGDARCTRRRHQRPSRCRPSWPVQPQWRAPAVQNHRCRHRDPKMRFAEPPLPPPPQHFANATAGSFRSPAASAYAALLVIGGWHGVPTERPQRV